MGGGLFGRFTTFHFFVIYGNLVTDMGMWWANFDEEDLERMLTPGVLCRGITEPYDTMSPFRTGSLIDPPPPSPLTLCTLIGPPGR